MKKVWVLTMGMFFSCLSWADPGLVVLKSPYTVDKTADRLESILLAKDLTIFARVNHAKGAEHVGLQLNPTQVFIFGNPKAGTLLMQCAPTSAIDLPLKFLIWRATTGEVFVAYNDLAYLKKRHQIEGCDAVLSKMAAGLKAISQKTISAE